MMTIDGAWIGPNGLVKPSYFNVLFERGLNEALRLLGQDGMARRENEVADGEGAIFIASEAHVRYLQDLPGDTPVRVTVRLIDYDNVHIHVYLSLHHGAEGWLCATSEQILSHVDADLRCELPIPDAMLERVAGMKAVHGALPEPDDLGRRVEIFPRS
ncbi:thioesterase family protein [Aquabacter sp. L1I39]|uniref:thioesterase family protein n=1 Tax=Aquabacter sp. L1I39 TaxID=2820278 RepID=UPI001FFD32D1|nr:thioesterase family protein [Aquabacter sp. L1I39]